MCTMKSAPANVVTGFTFLCYTILRFAQILWLESTRNFTD
jgi:hypothetical protein